MVAVFCWGTGAILEVAVGAWRRSELRLWRRLHQHLRAGEAHGVSVRRMSFKGSLDRLNGMLPYLKLLAGQVESEALLGMLLRWIAHDPVPDRPIASNPAGSNGGRSTPTSPNREAE